MSSSNRHTLARGWALAASAGLTLVIMLVIAAATAVAGPRPAARAGAKAAAAPLVATSITFQSLRDGAGQTVSLQADGCGAGHDLSALYAAPHGRAVLYHNYSGTLTACHLDRALTSGQVTVRWSTALRLSLALRASARPAVVRHRVGTGCTASTTRVHYVASGTLIDAIHAAKLGLIRRSRLTATLARTVVPACVFSAASLSSLESLLSGGATSQSAAVVGGDQLEGMWGNNDTLNAETARGLTPEVTFSEPANDGPTPGVEDEFAASLVGAGVFTPAANLQTATLDFTSPVSSGTLTFTAGVGCPPTIRAQDGTFSGIATVDDPVLGAVRLDGSLMSQGQLSVAAADAYKCAPVNFGED